jgi:long-chain acyl-CoA synthetase
LSRSSIADLVADFERRGDDVAFISRRGFRTVRWTYAETSRVARQFCTELAVRSLAKGDRVVLLGESSAEWVAAFLGCALYGAIAVPLDRGSSPEFVSRILEQVGASLAVSSAEAAKHFRSLPVIPLESLPSLVAKHAPASTNDSATRTDILEIIFTSGTTADPKGVVITHGNVLANLEPLEREIAKYSQYEQLVHPLRFLVLLPLSHVFGQFLSIFVPQALGAAVIFQESLNPSEIISTIQREQANVCVAVPHILSSLRNHLERVHPGADSLTEFQARLDHEQSKHFLWRWWKFRKVHSVFGWRFWAFISGGSALDEQDERFWAQLAIAVIQGYGLTETTSLVSVNHPFKSNKRSIGKMLPGREVKLAADGEILVRGENVATHYWQSNELKAAAVEDGWFPTGDLGAIDANGNLYFKGRKKSVIVTPAGMNIHPEDLEHALRNQPGVRDAVVVAVPVGGNAEPFAAVLLHPGANAAAIVHAANQHLAEFQRIHQFIEWPEVDFPRTPTQKPLIGAIEQYVRLQGSKRTSGGIDDVLAQLSPGNAASTPAELNLNSMEKVELMATLESRYQVDLSETQFAEANTINDLQKIVSGIQQPVSNYVYPRWPRRWPFPWLRASAYWLFAFPATMLLAKPKIIGRENLRDLREPALIVCNHVTMIDIGFVLAALPPAMRTKVAPAMQGEMLEAMRAPKTSAPFQNAISRVEYYLLTALFNVFPLPQKSGFIKSFSFAGENIDSGYSVLVFPEGRRTQDGQLSGFQAGVGMLATRLNVPVIPMRIDGLFEAAQAKSNFIKPNQIVVRVGAPVRYDAAENPTSIARDLECRVREL